MTTIIIASDRKWTESLQFTKSFTDRTKILRVRDEVQLCNALETEEEVELVFFPYWSKIIEARVYESFECVVFHMTDLPYGRGGSPLQNLIIRGKDVTKISALKCGREIDGGPLYAKRHLSLVGSAQEIYLRSVPIIAEMIEAITTDRPTPRPQLGPVTYFRRRKPNQSELPNNLSEGKLFDFIRMHDAEGYPKAFIRSGKQIVELTNAMLEAGSVKASATFVNFRNRKGRGA